MPVAFDPYEPQRPCRPRRSDGEATPDPGFGEPLVRHEARITAAPTPQGRHLPAPGPNPLRLRRETEIASLLGRGRDPQALSAEGRAEGDRRRPTELASHREEARQIQAISRIVCQAAAEALAGSRPVVQLQRWLEAEVYAKVAERVDLMGQVRSAGEQSAAGTVPKSRVLDFHSIRTDRIAAGVWEVAVIFGDDTRVRACALRLEAHRRRWRVVAMELG